MKKDILIAVAALVALSACQKMENLDEWPDMEVTFQANNYVRQTHQDRHDAERHLQRQYLDGERHRHREHYA